MTALTRLSAELGATPRSASEIRAVRAGAARIHDYRMVYLCDAALREATGASDDTPVSCDAVDVDTETVQCMQQHGGNFIKHLAACWLVADPKNQARLKTAFAEEFVRYREHAARIAKGPAHYTEMAREASAMVNGAERRNA